MSQKKFIKTFNKLVRSRGKADYVVIDLWKRKLQFSVLSTIQVNVEYEILSKICVKC